MMDKYLDFTLEIKGFTDSDFMDIRDFLRKLNYCDESVDYDLTHKEFPQCQVKMIKRRSKND